MADWKWTLSWQMPFPAVPVILTLLSPLISQEHPAALVQAEIIKLSNPSQGILSSPLGTLRCFSQVHCPWNVPILVWLAPSSLATFYCISELAPCKCLLGCNQIKGTVSTPSSPACTYPANGPRCFPPCLGDISIFLVALSFQVSQRISMRKLRGQKSLLPSMKATT